jgi:hypothetical protein
LDAERHAVQIAHLANDFQLDPSEAEMDLEGIQAIALAMATASLACEIPVADSPMRTKRGLFCVPQDARQACRAVQYLQKQSVGSRAFDQKNVLQVIMQVRGPITHLLHVPQDGKMLMQLMPIQPSGFTGYFCVLMLW